MSTIELHPHNERLAVQHFLGLTGNDNRLAGQSVQSSHRHLEEAVNSLAESHGITIMADVGEGGKITSTPTFDATASWIGKKGRA